MANCFYLVMTAVCIVLLHNQVYVDALVMPAAMYQGQMCVCSQHTNLFIYPTTSEHVNPIGALYTGDCRLYDAHTGPVGMFLPVIHEHQTGYVYQDVNVNLVECPNFVVDPADKLTTTLPPHTSHTPNHAQTTTNHALTTTNHALTTSFHAHTITNNAVTTSNHAVTTPFHAQTTVKPAGCNGVALFTDIAYHKNVGIHNYVKCRDGIHYDSDAVISAFCSAPDPPQWLPGIQVTSHCNQLPEFTPIAVFDRQSTYQKAAAILLECTSNYIYLKESYQDGQHFNKGGYYYAYRNNLLVVVTSIVAMQSCIHGLRISKISTTDNPSASDYRVIEWL